MSRASLSPPHGMDPPQPSRIMKIGSAIVRPVDGSGIGVRIDLVPNRMACVALSSNITSRSRGTLTQAGVDYA